MASIPLAGTRRQGSVIDDILFFGNRDLPRHVTELCCFLRKQVRGFTKFFTLSFLWSFFQWFYAGGDVCGFSQFPTFGLEAWKQT